MWSISEAVKQVGKVVECLGQVRKVGIGVSLGEVSVDGNGFFDSGEGFSVASAFAQVDREGAECICKVG